MARTQTLAHHLRETRLKKGYSVAEVAERIGVTPAAVYVWETDRGHPRQENLAALCKVLKLPLRATRERFLG